MFKVIIAATLLSTSFSAAGQSTPDAEEADRFVEEVNAELKSVAPLRSAAHWAAQTYINEDTQRLSSAATDATLQFLSEKAEASRRFLGLELSEDTARALHLLRLSTAMPAPSDPAKRQELSRIAASMQAHYGSARWCRQTETGREECLSLPQIERIIDDPVQPPELRKAAWAGWRAAARPLRQDYRRFVELINEGSRELEFDDAGELWRAGFDMTPAEFETETERLWAQVKPLYDELHCYVRARLHEIYPDLVPEDGLIPSHLLGNMWAQQWAKIYDQVAPFPGVGDLDVTSNLRARREAIHQRLNADIMTTATPEDLVEIERKADLEIALEMTRIAEDFYTSIGFPTLPESFYEKSLLVKPRDREVVCHASAWNMNLDGDVRIKQCIEPTESQLHTIHHELGHIYYYLAHRHLPALFQSGAHEGFHEAVGDAITLSLTPEHLQRIGLISDYARDERAVINSQMKLALDKIVFLPWGKLVDQWRWKVFSGEVPPDQYNQAWWELRERYQGVSAPLPRSEKDFDPGAKYHIPNNTPYTRYFLSFILQFQFHRALCQAGGFEGPLDECVIYGNQDAGQRFWEMLGLGASRPWQDALEQLTGTREMDASAMIDYFQPLLEWLREQNRGRRCGW